MTSKTLSDCAECKVHPYCNAHNSLNPGWLHRAGVNPCSVSIGDDLE
jgi:hypothetical protein